MFVMLTQKITLIVSWFIVGIVITVSRAANYKTKHTLENHSRVRLDEVVWFMTLLKSF